MIFLNEDIENDKNKAQHIKNKLEYTLIKRFSYNCKIYYDPLKLLKNQLLKKIMDY